MPKHISITVLTGGGIAEHAAMLISVSTHVAPLEVRLVEHRVPVERTGPDENASAAIGAGLILIDSSSDSGSAWCADGSCAIAPSAESPEGQ
ncbi:hypothetical protein [Haloactinopolyspora sp.]|uniref:hypothetical protein n=1 Tax=Haloactinopolyspora sp. TaxID=1966353 RepID=UPI00261E891D|nr:hypothetical protein [Haloactinopolyspora sp.]